ncbi:MAG: Rpn family recombination-promoting nuclease/putative transposase [Candidatus Azobacteroides sp.]|nr:Rpn family recombination-promoting nuclease/putative transposase [Candidatus Azobacteroides sp.]
MGIELELGLKEPRYLNPLVDYGFKRIFGSEAYKELLIDFLNELIEDQGKIVSLSYLPPEQLGQKEEDRKAVFDIYCQTDTAKYFIVELQKVRQAHFKERSIYYSTFPIQTQAKKGKWDFRLRAVYTIAIMDFILFDDDENYFHDIKLIEESTGKVFYDKLVYKYLELPKFTKSINELETNFDRWVYLLKKLPTFENRPPELKGKIFDMLFRVADISQLTPEEMEKYKKHITEYADIQDAMLYEREVAMEKGRKEGMEKGREEGMEKAAVNCLKLGMPIEEVVKITGLSRERIKSL